MKYSDKNNSFNLKLTIFYDICARANILSKILLEVFVTIITSLTSNCYYSNISISITITFNNVCKLIQIYFKKAEYKKNILYKPNMTTLNFIIKKNEEKLIEKCF